MTPLEFVGLCGAVSVATFIGSAAAELSLFYVRRAQMLRDEKAHMERMRKSYQDQVQEVRNFVETITGKKPMTPGKACPKCHATGSFIVVQVGDKAVNACVSCGEKFEVAS